MQFIGRDSLTAEGTRVFGSEVININMLILRTCDQEVESFKSMSMIVACRTFAGEFKCDSMCDCISSIDVVRFRQNINNSEHASKIVFNHVKWFLSDEMEKKRSSFGRSEKTVRF